MNIEKLNHLSLLEMSGEDCADFLQGQLTNDIKLLSANWQYSGYCSPKGRLLALFKIWRVADTYYALCDASIVDNIVKRLRMYVMRSKVSISLVENAHIYAIESLKGLPEAYQLAFGDTDSASPEHADDSDKALPQSLAVAQIDDTACSLLRAGQHSLLIAHEHAIESIEPNAEPGWWLQSEIAAGQPRVSAQSNEMFIPQMLNLDVLGGINFKKGCYTGQEIVARMHYLGKLKQRMYLCQADSTGELQVGQKIFADAALQKAAGNIVSCSPGHDKLLAVLRIEQVNEKAASSNDTFYTQSGVALSVLAEQPYSLPS